jgi:DNA-binding XRE family transcriptional regulator
LNGNPQYREALPSWGGGAMTTYFDPGKYNAPELWGKVRAMDTITLDVMLVVMALICDPRNKAKAPNLGWVTLHPEQVMNLKAFQRRGHDKRVMAQRTLEAMKTLSELNTDIVRVPYKWNRERTKVIDWVTERGCKIFHIGSVAYREQGELFEHPDEYPEDKEVVAIHIFAGRWAHYWLNEVKDGQHYDWMSVASQALLQLGETPVERAAKRFGALLLTMPGATGPFLRTQEDTHAGVLEAIGELCKDEYRGKVTGGDRKGQDWGRRMEKRLYGGEDDNGTYRPGVFDVLVEIGLLESYEKPVDALTDEANRRRGWVDDWLARKVRWTASAAAANIQAAERKTAQQDATGKLSGTSKPRRRNRGTGKPKKGLTHAQYLDNETITALYVAYRERNWTQATLAQHVKCARSTLSNILRRREAPGAELATRIRAFLDSPLNP